MATNLLKKYNELLELIHSSFSENLKSLRRIFNRDISDNPSFKFRSKQIHPTPIEGEDKMDTLFRHLTTKITNEAERAREFESSRAVRLHWIRHHVEEQSAKCLLIFSVEDESRTYILDKIEKYVIVLEPLRKVDGFYLLSAYPLQSSSYKKIMQKFERRGREGLL